MVSPTRRREAVDHLQREHHVSERRACRVLGQARATQRYRPRKKDDQAMIVKQMHQLVRRHPRFGYRRIHALLRRAGFKINRKRVWRLWKQEGFKVPQKQGKKRRLGVSANGIERHGAERIDHVWAWDFIHDRDEKGRAIKTLSIVDEFTRECLALEVGRSFKAVDVLDVLRELFVIRGVPKHIRSDNGPEFIAHAIRAFLTAVDVGTLYIEPGAPWQNGYAERRVTVAPRARLRMKETICVPRNRRTCPGSRTPWSKKPTASAPSVRSTLPPCSVWRSGAIPPSGPLTPPRKPPATPNASNAKSATTALHSHKEFPGARHRRGKVRSCALR